MTISLYYESKVCNHCHQELPANIEHFYLHSGQPDGFDPTCKRCRYSRRYELRAMTRLQMTTGLPTDHLIC